MKTIEEKAKAYDNAVINGSRLWECGAITRENYEYIFSELAESEDEAIRKAILELVKQSSEILDKQNQNNMINWLEKQGEKKPIVNVPPREVILSIWDLGNEWKELTKGSISTEYGTQLDYIQKHWHESEYYLREKQGEQKPVSKEYTFKSIPRLLDMIEPTDRAKSYCKKLIDSLQTEGYSVDAKIVGECLKQMNGEKVAMAVMDNEKQDEKKSQRMVSAEAKEALYDKPTDEEMKELLRTEYEKGRADTIAEMKSSWSEEDEKQLMKAIWYVDNPAPLVLKDTMLIEWLKQLKQRIGG